MSATVVEMRIVETSVAVPDEVTAVWKFVVDSSVAVVVRVAGCSTVAVLNVSTLVAVVEMPKEVVRSGRHAGRALALGTSVAPRRVTTEIQCILRINESSRCKFGFFL